MDEQQDFECIPTLRSLCLDYIASIGTQGVDLLDLGKTLPPDCFLDVLERLILRSKISLGLAFNIILALQDYDDKYFLPDTQLHVKCEECGIIGEIEVCKPRLQAHLYECDLCHISLCKRCLVMCDTCNRKMCKRCIEEVKAEGVREDVSIGDWGVREIIFTDLYRPPVEAEGSSETSPFTCFTCVLAKHYNSIRDRYFQQCDVCSFLKERATLNRCCECKVNLCGRCRSFCDQCYSSTCFPCKHHSGICVHCDYSFCCPKETQICKLCEQPVCDACAANVYLQKETIVACPECNSTHTICAQCHDFVKMEFNCNLCNQPLCPKCSTNCCSYCHEKLCNSCRHFQQRCVHCEQLTCTEEEPLSCQQCSRPVCVSCATTVYAMTYFKADRSRYTRRDSMELCPECVYSFRNKSE